MIANFVNHITDKNAEYIIFDIGSRDCGQSIEFYHAFPRAKIYAFECNPNTLPLCRKNIEPYVDRITLIEGAVCDYDGDITFYPINQQKTRTTWADGNPGASSLFRSNGQYTVETYVQDEIKTNCHRLDTVMRERGIPRVDLIWMDLQGAELLALRGAGEFMDGVQYVYTEVSHKEMYTGQVMFSELNQFMLSNRFIVKNQLSMNGWQEDALYEKMPANLFDIVITVGPNDRDVIHAQLEYTKRNIIGYRNIYLVCYDPTIQEQGCITVDERVFPFSIDTVASFHGKLERNGWYLQQLLKLYAGTVIPGILARYLVIDSDTFFCKPTAFIYRGKCAYSYGVEYHIPYFKHMARLNGDWNKVDMTKSGICHHMIFETEFAKEMMRVVEELHDDKFYNVFLSNVVDFNGSGASEYEIYFNYMLKYHSDKIVLRKLNFANVSSFPNSNHNLDYFSWHWHIRS